MKAIRTILLMLVAWAATFGAAQATVLIVRSEEGGAYAQAQDALQAELEKAGRARSEVRQQTLADFQLSSIPEPTRLIVALGANAFRAAMKRSNGLPVLAALLPRTVFERILREAPAKSAAMATAVFLDQPLGRQLDLLHLAFPEARKVGILLGPETAGTLAPLQAMAVSRKLQIVSASAPQSADLYPALRSVMETADVLLATADPSIYNSASISNVLLSTYRARVPVQAFSPAYVRAGAVLALYSTPEQIGQQAAELARVVLSGGSLPPPAFPAAFEVDVNEHVARSLGLRLDEDALRERLLRLERSDRQERQERRP